MSFPQEPDQDPTSYDKIGLGLLSSHYQGVDPAATEFLALLNEARADPQAWAQKVEMPPIPTWDRIRHQPPLAWNDQLAISANYHAVDLLAHHWVSHLTSDKRGGWWMPNFLARHIGRYPLPASWVDGGNQIESVGQNIGAAGMLYQFLQDYGVPGAGHRVHLLGIGTFFSTHTDCGVAVARDPAHPDAIQYWVVHTAHR